MPAQMEHASKEMRLKLAEMQRALFLMWLARPDHDKLRALEEATEEVQRGTVADWDEVRRELNAKFGI